MAELKLKKWGITFPVAGAAYVEVEAATKEQAIEQGWEKVHDVLANLDPDAITELEAYEEIVSGNVMHAPTNEISVEKIK